MTTIAWDGKILAADRMVTSGDSIVGSEKKLAIFYGDHYGVATGCGSSDDISAFIDWVKKGCLEDRKPSIDDDDFMGIAIICGRLMEYGKSLTGNRIKYKTAWGGGADFAIAFMDLVPDGTAIGAVKYAATRHVGTAEPVDFYEVIEDVV